MERGLSGHYLPSIAGGIACQAFIPAPLPPEPALQVIGKLQSRMNQAMLALGRLDAISTLLPDAHLFLYSYSFTAIPLQLRAKRSRHVLANRGHPIVPQRPHAL